MSALSRDGVLVWYRNDLRVHDHEPLRDAAASGARPIPVYCLDPRSFGSSPSGIPRTGPFRARFLLESLADLRRTLRGLGSDLVILRGHPETQLPRLALACRASAVAYHMEAATEELEVERALGDSLRAVGVEAKPFWGATLYHPDDLPFPSSQLPDVFTAFRKRVERESSIRRPLEAPRELPPLEDVQAGPIPTLAELGIEEVEADPRAALRFVGGESAGLARVEDYVWKRDLLRRYKHTRNGMLGGDYSSKLSPWLAAGCLSPRRVHQEVSRYEVERVRNDSTYWLVFELLWRDYFRFVAREHGRRLFLRSGLRGLELPWRRDPELFERFRDGMTGYPLVDANLRELRATGFMSNRGRQNVASFFTKNLGLDWRLGAEWFEYLLIDYDVCSNWGNWAYAAGVGNDARGFRYFNLAKQARDYDPEGRYVKHWLPELARVPAGKVHEPWRLGEDALRRAGVRLGVDYPLPVVDFGASLRESEAGYEAATGTRGRNRPLSSGSRSRATASAPCRRSRSR